MAQVNRPQWREPAAKRDPSGPGEEILDLTEDY
jgi:hypothetical protein